MHDSGDSGIATPGAPGHHMISGPTARLAVAVASPAPETTRRYPIARRERRELDAPAVEEPIAGNEEGIGPVANEGGERRLNF
jgi:hypothetical protein